MPRVFEFFLKDSRERISTTATHDILAATIVSCQPQPHMMYPDSTSGGAEQDTVAPLQTPFQPCVAGHCAHCACSDLKQP